jgi:isoquinoline 1-oxidoreductase beta subunit
MSVLTRRAFLISGGLLGGGLALGLVLCPDRLSLRASVPGEFSLVTWLRIRPDNTVTILVPHVEMGQGSQTALAMMLAEELDADWAQVRVEQAPAEGMFATGDVVRFFLLGEREFTPGIALRLDMATYQVASLMDMQITGGSLSIRSTGRLGMRRAGAAAREMLLRAAAQQWGVAVGECRTESGTVVHGATDRSIAYGALAPVAAALKPPRAPRLKSRKDYRLCGQSPRLIHIEPAVRGNLTYGMDAKVPGMKYAAIRHVPQFGGAIGRFDAAAVSSLPGVREVLQIPGAIAIVADSYWQAQRALDQLAVEFVAPEVAAPDTEALNTRFEQLLATGKVKTDFKQGAVLEDHAQSDQVHVSNFAVPFLAHATMEPMNCTAWLRDGKLEIWTSTQDPLGARAVAAKAVAISEKAVTVHALHLGGGFGRRTPGSFNYVADAAHISRQVNYPVKMLWSREEDIRHDNFRPAVQARMQAEVGDNGLPRSWMQVYTDIGYNQDRGAASIPYGILNQRIGRVTDTVNVPLGYWRSVEHSYQGFFIESFVDELARRAGTDPLEFRLRLLQAAPRFQRVLQRSAELIGWGDAPRPGTGKGIAVKESFGSIVAEAAEVEVSAAGALRVLRICAAVDAGEVVHPDNAHAQVEGGILFGLGAALKGRITLKHGRVEQGNFNDYPVLTMAETPEIEVALLDSDAAMGGIGEVGVPPCAPAICNAIFAATGVRVRHLPIIGQALNS